MSVTEAPFSMMPRPAAIGVRLQTDIALPGSRQLAAAMMGADVLLTAGCWFAFVPFVQPFAASPFMLLAFLAPGALALWGLYPGDGLMRPERLRRRWLASAMAGAGLSLFSTMVPQAGWPIVLPVLAMLHFGLLSPLTEAGILSLSRTGYRDRWARLPEPTPLRPASRVERAVKRAIDLVVGGVAFLVALPVIVLFSGLVFLADPGWPLFTQVRVGQRGRPVKIWKIRSMSRNAEACLPVLLADDARLGGEWGRCCKLRRDPRVLGRLGRFIRRHSIDELPQLWNVLRGDMSLVGPRIFTSYDLGHYNAAQLAVRQEIMPGLTGLWQVSGRNSGDNVDKVRFDMLYARNRSTWLDLDILYRTVGVVISGRGAY